MVFLGAWKSKVSLLWALIALWLVPIPGGPTVPNIPPGAFTGLFGTVGFRALQGFFVGLAGPVRPCRSVRIGGVVGPIAVGTVGPIGPVFTGPIGPVKLVEAIGSGDSGEGGCAEARAACGARGVAGACIARVVARAPHTRLQTTRRYVEIYSNPGLFALQRVVV
jgi:hypothetical protein